MHDMHRLFKGYVMLMLFLFKSYLIGPIQPINYHLPIFQRNGL
ncbi:hypothetical protein QWZ13_08580 [Reinekea marina]|nr:hypothetical protein [Reinekea marina]MDN3648964.1 hypothetical protein [Reinekea marina]